MTKKLPYTASNIERAWFRTTPKRVLFEIARDYATQMVGEKQAADPQIVFNELLARQRIVEYAGLDKQE